MNARPPRLVTHCPGAYRCQEPSEFCDRASVRPCPSAARSDRPSRRAVGDVAVPDQQTGSFSFPLSARVHREEHRADGQRSGVIRSSERRLHIRHASFLTPTRGFWRESVTVDELLPLRAFFLEAVVHVPRARREGSPLLLPPAIDRLPARLSAFSRAGRRSRLLTLLLPGLLARLTFASCDRRERAST